MAHEEVLPADLEDEYRTVRIPTGLTEDKWLLASEVRPGNYEVVHHVGVSASNASLIPYGERAREMIGAVAGYVPGQQTADSVPEGEGGAAPGEF